MTDRPMSDMAALLNEPEAVDPADAVRQAELAEAVRNALSSADSDHATRSATAEDLAAHLDGAASAADRNATAAAIARSPEALAEADASVALLEAVAADTTPVPAALMARARQTLLAAQPKELIAAKPAPWWAAGFKAVSPRQLGFSVAALAAVALVVVMAPSRTTPPVTGSAVESPQGASQGPALLGSRQVESSRAASPWRGAVAPAPQRDSGWSAVVVSRSASTYGAGVNWPTRAEAEVAALATCVQNGSNDCVLADAAEGQCVSMSSRANGRPLTRVAADKATAEQSALETCGRDCAVVVTACSGK